MLENRRREGFSLVEVLIVIIIIAILAGLLVMGLGGTQESADATRLINGIKALKSAYIACYADTHKYLPANAGAGASSDLVASLEKYAGKSLFDEIHAFGSVTIQTDTGGGVYIGYLGGSGIHGNSSASKIYAELLRRADAVKLRGHNGGPLVENDPILMQVK